MKAIILEEGKCIHKIFWQYSKATNFELCFCVYKTGIRAVTRDSVIFIKHHVPGRTVFSVSQVLLCSILVAPLYT